MSVSNLVSRVKEAAKPKIKPANQPSSQDLLTDPFETPRASFLRDYDLNNLPRDAEIWARAVRIPHSQKAAEPTQRALKKLEKLDPAKAKAMREEISRDTDIGLDLTRGTDG
jgi:hypothetical protein